MNADDLGHLPMCVDSNFIMGLIRQIASHVYARAFLGAVIVMCLQLLTVE
jgi:hypothetical protein